MVVSTEVLHRLNLRWNDFEGFSMMKILELSDVA
jgi:hypothetical protein